MGSYSSDIMPLVQGFLKSQVYVDKTMYQRKLYGNRLFTDYYHTEFGIEDSEVAETDPVIRSADLSKIGVSWNIGYARCFDFYGEYLAGAYKRLPLSVILRLRPSFRSARKLRRQRVYSRMGLNFPRETIGFQRKAMADLLGKQSRVSRWDYYKQMRDSQVVISPFGWGEINNRDFEAFTAGCILVKPSVDHLETFPNWFIKGETYVPYKWDMSDMSGILDDVVTKYSQYQDIAISAQELYQDCVFSREGRQAFVDHFKVLLGF